MKKILIAGIFWSLLLNIFIKGLWIFGIEVYVQRAVGAQAYGTYFSLFNISLIGYILLDFGLTNFNVRNLSKHPQLFIKHFGQLFAVKMLLAIIYFSALALIAFFSDFNRQQWLIILALGGVQFFNSFTQYLRSNIAAQFRLRLDSAVSILDRLLLIIVFAVWLLFGITGQTIAIETFAVIQLLTGMATFFTVLLINFKIAKKLFRLNLNLPFVWVILKKCFPFALLMLLMQTYMRSDGVLLKYLLDDGGKQAGIYAAAFRLFDAFSQITIILSAILLPVFSGIIQKREKALPFIKIVIGIIAIPAIWLMCICIINPVSLATLLYDEYIQTTANLFVLLGVALLPYAFALITGTYITAAGKLRWLNKVACVALLISITFNVLLIPIYGAIASAATAIIVHLYVAICQGIKAYTIMQENHKLLFAMQILIFATIVVVSIIIANIFTNHILWVLLFSGCISLLAGFVVKLINLNDVKLLLQKKQQAETENT